MKTIGLCMIVKNESKIIRQCLTSVLPIVDYVFVVDTGSEDGTQQIIRDFLTEHGVRGTVIDEPWRDFAYNRTFALERLREVEDIDYAMIIDADDTLELDAGFDPHVFKAQMTHDLYDVPVRHGNIAHYRPQLFSNRLPFSFKGVLHEYLEAAPGNLSRETVKGFAIRASTGGARSENPRKYQDDAAVLERALATETNPFLISRYTFYLAQSYKDCGERQKALANYLKRAELGHWSEEIFVSLLEAGNLMAALDRPFDEVIATWERATQTVPTRVEALHAASLYCRDKGKNAEGMEFARRGIDLTQPNGLFVQPWVYDYGILDEFAINAYWAGAYRESLDASLKLLTGDKLPPSEVRRVAANARFAADKLPASKPPNLGRLGAEDFIQQHALAPQRPLRSRVKDWPRIMVAILAKQKEPALSLYLECIEALDYPKSSIVLYIHTNTNIDKTEQILRDWVARIRHLYHSVELDASGVAERVEQDREHEGNAQRSSFLGRVRNQSMRRARDLGCDFYLVADVDSFIGSATLRELVALDLPIVAPFLRSTTPEQFYSNYHAEIDANGYYKDCDQYFWLLERRVRGVVEVPVVHSTYLVRADVIPELTYQDETGRHEYAVFSDSARKAGIPQYLDNRQVYGYITFGEGGQDLQSITKALSGGKAGKRRVVWHRPGAIGDVLITLNLVNLYKKENPNDWVIYKAAPSIANMLRAVMLEAGVDEVVTTDEHVACDKQFDLIGYPLHEGYPEKPMARHLIQYFSEELGLGGRHEALELKLPKRTIDLPYITLHANSAWSMYKNWPLDRWAWVCRELKKLGIPVVQLGGPDDPPVEGVEFNRIGLPFMESLELLANAELHVGIDSWSNHATNIVWEGKGKVPGVILWGSTQASAAGYLQNHNINLGLPCQPCFREDPRISSVPRGVCPNPPGQTYEKPLHACMHGISREHVLDVIVEEYANRPCARPATIPLSAACSAVSSDERPPDHALGAAIQVNH